MHLGVVSHCWSADWTHLIQGISNNWKTSRCTGPEGGELAKVAFPCWAHICCVNIYVTYNIIALDMWAWLTKTSVAKEIMFANSLKKLHWPKHKWLLWKLQHPSLIGGGGGGVRGINWLLSRVKAGQKGGASGSRTLNLLPNMISNHRINVHAKNAQSWGESLA